VRGACATGRGKGEGRKAKVALERLNRISGGA
jgi:hypothetical protein